MNREEALKLKVGNKVKVTGTENELMLTKGKEYRITRVWKEGEIDSLVGDRWPVCVESDNGYEWNTPELHNIEKVN